MRSDRTHIFARTPFSSRTEDIRMRSVCSDGHVARDGYQAQRAAYKQGELAGNVIVFKSASFPEKYWTD
ncbi:MAG: hypothetical protein ABI885_25380 [Gammaproteobacteria bacterium]